MPGSGIVLANEFLDALPVHRVIQRRGRLPELFVDWEAGLDRFVERPGEPSTPAPWPRALPTTASRSSMARSARSAWRSSRGSTRSPGCWARARAWSSTTAIRPPVLYDPARVGGTLRGLCRPSRPRRSVHRDRPPGPDRARRPDRARDRRPGRPASTSWARSARPSFLIGCGLEELLDRIRSNPATTMEEWLAVRSAIARLLDPAALGGFRVVLLGRGLDPEPPLRGLSARRPGRAEGRSVGSGAWIRAFALLPVKSPGPHSLHRRWARRHRRGIGRELHARSTRLIPRSHPLPSPSRALPRPPPADDRRMAQGRVGEHPAPALRGRMAARARALSACLGTPRPPLRGSLDRDLVHRRVRRRRDLVRVPHDRRGLAASPTATGAMSTRACPTSRGSTPSVTPTAGSGCRSTSTPCCSSPSISRWSSSTSGRSSSGASCWAAS